VEADVVVASWRRSLRKVCGCHHGDGGKHRGEEDEVPLHGVKKKHGGPCLLVVEVVKRERMNQRESIETLRGGCLEIFYTSVECGSEPERI
jgi:hypothetical protein